jgi:hypothetical protein
MFLKVKTTVEKYHAILFGETLRDIKADPLSLTSIMLHSDFPHGDLA